MNRRQLLIFSCYLILGACGVQPQTHQPKRRLTRPDSDPEPIPRGKVKFPGISKREPEDNDTNQDSNTLSGPLKGLNVALTVGHGRTTSGFDQGASRDGIVEYELNVKQSETIEAYLSAKGASVKVFHYDKNHAPIGLVERGENTEGYDIHVSLHHNAFSDTSVQGGEVLVGGPNLTKQDKVLAQHILDHMIDATGVNKRGIKEVNLAVLRGTPKPVAKCLTEPFFITHADMNESVASEKSHKAAQGIAKGIESYWNEQKYASIASVEEPETLENDLEGLYDDKM